MGLGSEKTLVTSSGFKASDPSVSQMKTPCPRKAPKIQERPVPQVYVGPKSVSVAGLEGL